MLHFRISSEHLSLEIIQVDVQTILVKHKAHFIHIIMIYWLEVICTLFKDKNYEAWSLTKKLIYSITKIIPSWDNKSTNPTLGPKNDEIVIGDDLTI